MKPFTKGLLVGLLLAFSCVGFMASKSKSNPVGTYVTWGAQDINIMDTRTGVQYAKRHITQIDSTRHITWAVIASVEEIEYYKEERK